MHYRGLLDTSSKLSGGSAPMCLLYSYIKYSCYLHRHEADQDDHHLGQLEEVELLLLDTALPLLLPPEVITSVNNGNISTCLMFCRSITASPKQ